jgi:AcrR family transcriptional regulator
MARRNKHSREELQALAVAAVLDIAQREGVHAVTARSVAKQIGYAPGMLYHLFDNRDDLILRANALTLEDLAAAMEKAAGKKSPTNALLAMASTYLDLAHRQAPRWRLLFEHVMTDGADVPVWYQARTAALFSLVERQLDLLAPNRPPSSRQLAARAIWTAVHGVCLLAVTGKLDVVTSVRDKALVESLVTHYLAGWLAA